MQVASSNATIVLHPSGTVISASDVAFLPDAEAGDKCVTCETVGMRFGDLLCWYCAAECAKCVRYNRQGRRQPHSEVARAAVRLGGLEGLADLGPAHFACRTCSEHKQERRTAEKKRWQQDRRRGQLRGMKK